MNAITRSREAVAAFKNAQAVREADPRFAQVVAAKKRLESARHMLTDLYNQRDAWEDASEFPFEMEEASRKREIERRRQQVVEATKAATFLGRVDVPSQAATGWTVSYHMDGFTTSTTHSKSFDTLEEAENFAKQLRGYKDQPIEKIGII